MSAASFDRVGSPGTQDATTPKLIQDSYTHTADYPELRMEGELVQIPYRLHYEWPGATLFRIFRQPSGLFWPVGDLLEADEAWTIPFIVQLCGEYVVEIGQDVLNFITHVLPSRPALREQYVRFAQNNPEFMVLTEHRAVSYWNDDYRGQLRKEEYPQLAALEAIGRLMP